MPRPLDSNFQASPSDKPPLDSFPWSREYVSSLDAAKQDQVVLFFQSQIFPVPIFLMQKTYVQSLMRLFVKYH